MIRQNEQGVGIVAVLALIGGLGVLAASEQAPDAPPSLQEQVTDLKLLLDQVRTSKAAPDPVERALIRANKALMKLER